MILAGDIGGFKTNLALFDEQLRLVFETPHPRWDFAGLETLVLRFRGEAAARDPERPNRALRGGVPHHACASTAISHRFKDRRDHP